MSPTEPSVSAAPPRKRRARALAWLAYAAAWLAFGVWLGINVIIGHRNGGQPIAAWEPLTWEISSVAVIALLALLVYRFERRLPLSGPHWARHVPAHLGAAIVFSLVHTAAMVGIRKLVYAAAGATYDFGDPWLGLAYELQKDLISYAVIVMACIALRTQRLRRERELAVVRLERDLSEARLAQLTAQIEPHFMFNTLNAISNRMHEDVDGADRMIAAFAELLRAALAESGSAHVRVDDDVAWLERYFELMCERFRGQLTATITLDPEARGATIPRLLLQPLVENAFQHGLKAGRGAVRVAIRADHGRLRCTIEDDGVGCDDAIVDGTGLRNVRSRLQLLHPHDHQLRLTPRTGGGTRVEIDLPLEQHGG